MKAVFGSHSARIIALILLAITGVSILYLAYMHVSTYYVLVSPLIPREVVNKISEPFLVVGIMEILFFVFALVLFFKKRYLLSATLSFIGLVGQEIIFRVFY